MKTRKTAKALRAPLLHFLLLGGGLFTLQAAFSQPGSPASSPDRVVAVSAAEVERLAQQGWRASGRAPSPEELEHRIREWVDEEILFREALALGWSRSDPVVQRRLIQNMRFLGDRADGEPAALLARARVLGLERSDLVVRRRLVERMKLAITATARRAEPDDAELEALLRREPERFRREARVRLTQLYLSRDRHGARLGAAARALLAELVAKGVLPEAAAGRGDPLCRPATGSTWCGCTSAHPGRRRPSPSCAGSFERPGWPSTSAAPCAGRSTSCGETSRCGSSRLDQETRKPLQGLWRAHYDERRTWP
jgi:hypothetical protein